MSIINIPMTINSDEKGYFDRECPNSKCLFTFKINTEDWKEKVSDKEVHCPLCGHVDTSDKWWTQAQLDGIRKNATEWATSYVQGELDKCFKRLEHSTHRNKFMKVTYQPNRMTTFTNNPIGTSSEWEQDIICSCCKTRYSVIGTAYFCPCCGSDMIIEVFFVSLENIDRMIDSIPDMERLFKDAHGKDHAVSMCKSMLENTLGDIVAAFQKFAEQIYKSLDSSKNVRVNDFQIVEKGSQLFNEAKQKPYSTWLSEEELSYMNIMFQKRHLIEHNGGIVDDIYVKKSGDYSYRIGQRLVIKNSEAKRLISIIYKLSKGLKELTP